MVRDRTAAGETRAELMPAVPEAAAACVLLRWEAAGCGGSRGCRGNADPGWSGTGVGSTASRDPIRRGPGNGPASGRRGSPGADQPWAGPRDRLEGQPGLFPARDFDGVGRKPAGSRATTKGQRLRAVSMARWKTPTEGNRRQRPRPLAVGAAVAGLTAHRDRDLGAITRGPQAPADGAPAVRHRRVVDRRLYRRLSRLDRCGHVVQPRRPSIRPATSVAVHKGQTGENG